MKLTSLQTLIAALALGSAGLHAQTVEVKDAWARATVAGQTASGAFMKITAKEVAQLVGADSSAAEVVEVHEMRLEGNVMRMRAAPVIDLPVGQTVELKPGGYHVMLMDLKAPLKAGSSLPLTLTFRNAKGVESKVQLQVPVRTAAPAGGVQGPGMMR